MSAPASEIRGLKYVHKTNDCGPTKNERSDATKKYSGFEYVASRRPRGGNRALRRWGSSSLSRSTPESDFIRLLEKADTRHLATWHTSLSYRTAECYCASRKSRYRGCDAL